MLINMQMSRRESARNKAILFTLHFIINDGYI